MGYYSVLKSNELAGQARTGGNWDAYIRLRGRGRPERLRAARFQLCDILGAGDRGDGEKVGAGGAGPLRRAAGC